MIFKIKLMRVNLNMNDLLKNIFLSFCVKGAAIIVGIFMIPAYLNYFSNSSILGVWFALLSLLSWISICDLGIGNGIRNNIARLLVTKDYIMIQKVISSGYMSIGRISMIFVVCSILMIYTLDFNEILNIDPKIIAASTLRQAISITMIGIIFNFILKLISSVLNAMGKTALTSTIPLLSNIMILIFITIRTQFSEPQKLLLLSLMYALAINIPYIFATLYVFKKYLPRSYPRFDKYESNIARDILFLGSKFFGIQCMFMIITITNEVFISAVFSPKYVVEFQIYNKVFYTLVTLFAIITNPIWSSITTSFYKNEYKSIVKIYHRMLYLALLVTLIICLTAFNFQFIVNIWLKDNRIIISSVALASFCFYAVALVFCFAESSIANGVGKLNAQIFGYAGAALIKICLIAFMSKYRELFSWYIIILIDGLCLIPYILGQHIVLRHEFAKWHRAGY